jgi:hypothetical protein
MRRAQGREEASEGDDGAPRGPAAERLESAAVGELVASTRAGADPLARGEEVCVSRPDEHTWAVPAQN